MFTGKTFREFNQAFQNENDCRQYLFDLKWENGFQCKRCGHTKCWKGRTGFHARCKKCDYDESATANTIFHKIQIPLLKAFPMANHIVICKNGVSTLELAKLYGVDEKTAMRFRLRCQEAMEAWFLEVICEKENVKLSIVDGLNLMHRGQNLNGLQKVEVELFRYSTKDDLFKLTLSKSTVPIPDAKAPCELIAGSYVGEAKDIRIWNFKKWVEGTHHHCSAKHVQKYEHEYYFRFNNRHQQEIIWHVLISSIVRHKPKRLLHNAA